MIGSSTESINPSSMAHPIKIDTTDFAIENEGTILVSS